MTTIATASPRIRFVIRLSFCLLPALAVLGTLNAAVPRSPQAPAVCVPTNAVGGLVYQDYNASGDRQLNGPIEQGVAGVTVTATDVNGVVTSTTTITDGTYSIPVANGTSVRIEFVNLTSGYLSGPFGGESRTTVAFTTSPDCEIDLGINTAGDYCQDNPALATNCYVAGYQLTQSLPVLISFPYNAGGSALPPGAQPPPTNQAASDQAGTTWGLAYQGASNSLFAAAFMKRHTGFGPGGTGGIYRVDASLPFGSPGKTSLFLDLDSGPYFPGSTGADPHPLGTDFGLDANGWDTVGKVGFGDMDISEDQQTLWAVNLNDRSLYRIPIGVPPSVPPASSIISFPVPLPATCPNAAANLRPFGVGTDAGLVYVGLTCTAETTQNLADMRAYVYSFNPSSFAYTEVLSFPLNYTRGCAVVPSCAAAAWNPWVTTFTVNATFYSPAPDFLYVYPQPWLTDIVFDNNGDMILGIRDRFGDQMGYQERSTNPADTNLYSGVAAGDILRACRTVSGGWALETNAACGGITTAGAGTGQGPGNGEYYFQENTQSPPVPANDHDEISLAGLELVPGYTTTAQTAYDTFQLYDGGVLWLNNSNGTRSRAYQAFTLAANPLTFGKAAGLGDLEAMCAAAPIEIGNRVWRDKTDVIKNGIQDAEDPPALEFPISGVTVRLYSVTGTLIAATTTGLRGEYYFNASNVPGGLQPLMTYTIRLDLPNDYALGGPLFGLTSTLPNVGGNDAIDSDGVIVNGYPQTTLVTGNYGDNDHTYDFGFVDAPTAVELLYFRVEGVSGRQVRLGWATAVEIDNFGFNLYRAPANDFGRAEPIHFEPSALKGSGPGATYAYTDSVPSDGEWWYWLADVDTQGHESVHAPTRAVVGVDGLLPNRLYLPVVFR